MESFQKRERDRRKILKRREKADRKKERSQAHAGQSDAVPSTLPADDSVPAEDPDAIRVAVPEPGIAGATP